MTTAKANDAAAKAVGAQSRWSNKRGLLICALVGGVTLILDQLTKIWALKALVNGRTVPLLGKWLELHLVRNSGAAFSMLSDRTWVFSLFALVIVVLIPFVVWRLKERFLIVMVGLLWGGALGNLIDRCFQPPGFPNGHVVDFIKYGDWFIGNVADIAIVIAAIGMVIYAFFSGGAKKSDEAAAQASASTEKSQCAAERRTQDSRGADRRAGELAEGDEG